MSYKNFYETNNYVINSFIIEKVKNLGLSLNDFLLLIYFINMSNKKFILDDIINSIFWISYTLTLGNFTN